MSADDCLLIPLTPHKKEVQAYQNESFYILRHTSKCRCEVFPYNRPALKIVGFVLTVFAFLLSNSLPKHFFPQFLFVLRHGFTCHNLPFAVTSCNTAFGFCNGAFSFTQVNRFFSY